MGDEYDEPGTGEHGQPDEAPAAVGPIAIARVVRGRVITISCLDNLIKGASGAAVQNFNLMFGYPETTGF